jgi:hypothetical protein
VLHHLLQLVRNGAFEVGLQAVDFAALELVFDLRFQPAYGLGDLLFGPTARRSSFAGVPQIAPGGAIQLSFEGFPDRVFDDRAALRRRISL